jgi:hypothetical protein
VNKLKLEENVIRFIYLLLAFLRSAESLQGVWRDGVVSGQSLTGGSSLTCSTFIVRQSVDVMSSIECPILH